MNPAAVTSSLTNLLLRLWHHLSRRRQRQYLLLVVLMLLSAFAEIVSLGAVVPFISILTAPELALQQPVIARTAEIFGVTSPDELVLPLTIGFALAAVTAGAIRMLLLWAGTRVAFATGTDLNLEVYRRTLYQPYWVHVARHSSEVISGIVNQVYSVVHGMLLPLFTFISSTVVLVAVTLALIAIDPVVALALAAGFSACYLLITWVVRQRLHRNSQRIAHGHEQAVKTLDEGLGAVRDVLLDGTQPLYCDIYWHADYPLRRAEANNAFIGGSPRYIMEASAMVVIAVLAYTLSRQPGGMATALPVLGALALAAQRLLPSLQQSYTAWASMMGTRAALDKAIKLLDQPLPTDVAQAELAPLLFEHAIRFRRVRFRYTTDGPWVLDGVNLTIPKGARVGIVGSTGSGKSTMIDLLMGLLPPTEGEILVDRQPISGRFVRAWQRNIAHVPQSIFLAASTVAENIAFGVPCASIDIDLVRYAARQAQIADFIESRREGYDALVGERGIRLSGGQRQRIGIARALYKQASVLVFDEATSALDNATEQSVMDGIEAVGRDCDLTILIIAHRLTTVRRCDMIVEMKNGRVVAQGTYDQLLESSPTFRSLARAVA